jgi:hypothetical protein
MIKNPRTQSQKLEEAPKGRRSHLIIFGAGIAIRIISE